MGSTSTASGSGTSPVSVFTAGVFLGVGISIVAIGRLLQYMSDIEVISSWRQRTVLAASPIGERNPTNEIASSSSTDETATTTSTDVATLLLSPPNGEMLEVVVQYPPTGSADELATISTSSVLAPTNAVASEVGPSEFAPTSSGHQPVAHFTVASAFVTTYSMVSEVISFVSSF